MKLNYLTILTASLPFLARAMASALPREKDFLLSPEEWQAKWDAWPTSDAETRVKYQTQVGNQTLVPQFGVCERLTGCLGAVGTVFDYAKVAAVSTVSFCGTQATTAAKAMSANNYALSKQVLAYVVTEIALPLVINEATFYINVKLQNDAPQSKQDNCGMSQAAAVAEQAGTATYGFCLQLKDVTSDKAFSRIDYGTVSSDNANDDIGLDMKMRLFISTVKGKYDTACSLLGVYLKRRGQGVLPLSNL